MLRWETFAELDAFAPGLRHAFSLRSPLPDEALAGTLHGSIHQLGWGEHAIVEAVQPHGNGVALVGADDAGATIAGVDALITMTPGVALAIRAADCGPIYFFDPVRRALAVVHSGKKGTQLDIVTATVAALQAKCGCRPADLVGFLGPCIRPPHYEIDFAAEIGRQAERAGVGKFHDSGLNTAEHPERYYSYRMEKGKTGRMWAVAMLGA